MTQRTVLTAVFLFIIGIGVFPIVTMFVASFVTNGSLSLQSYQGLLSSSREWVLLAHSFALAFLVSVSTTVVGVPLGILFGRTDLPLRRFFTVAFTIPLLIPTYITAVGWSDFLGAYGFLANTGSASVAQVAYNLLFNLPGCVFVLFSAFLPIVILLTITSLRSVNPRLEEAGKLVATWSGVLRRVTIPLIVPGISLGTILVFLLTIGEFSVPNFLRYHVFTLESFVQFSAFYNFGTATAAVVPLTLLTFIILLAEWMFLRERFHQVQATSDKTGLPPMELGKFKIWLFVLVALLCFTVMVLPLLVLIVRSFSVSVYAAAIAVAWDSLLRSLLYAVVGASLLAVIGFFMGYLIHQKAMPFWRTADTLTIFLFALPSTVIGLGLISMWNRPWTNFIYGTFAMIILGYLAKYTALTSRITATTLTLIPNSMEEAGQVAGLPWTRRIGSIVMPMAWKGILVSWLVAYIFCLRDLEITMIVYPPGYETLPVRITTLMANSPAELIAALCVLMVCATVLPAVVLWMFFTFNTRARNRETR